MRCGGTKEHWALQDTGEQKQGSEVEMRINRSKTHEFGLTESCVCLWGWNMRNSHGKATVFRGWWPMWGRLSVLSRLLGPLDLPVTIPLSDMHSPNQDPRCPTAPLTYEASLNGDSSDPQVAPASCFQVCFDHSSCYQRIAKLKWDSLSLLGSVKTFFFSM